MQIYVLRDNESTGPFSEDEIRSRFIVGTVTGATMVWWEGLPDWQPLGQTDWGAATGIRMPADIAPVVRRPSGAGRRKGIPALAIASVTMGVLGFLCAPLMGLGAVITGHLARAQIEKHDPLDRKGNVQAILGLMLGYAWLGLVAAILLFTPELDRLKDEVSKTYQRIQNQKSGDTNAPTQSPSGQ